MKQPIQNLLNKQHTRSIREFVAVMTLNALQQRGEISRTENLAAYSHAVNAAECGVLDALMLHFRGNQSAAAAVGGLNRATVRAIMERNNMFAGDYILPPAESAESAALNQKICEFATIHQIDVSAATTWLRQSIISSLVFEQFLSLGQDDLSMSKKFGRMWASRNAPEQWDIATAPSGNELTTMQAVGITLDKAYHDGGGKAVMFTDGSIYRNVFWGM